MQHLCRVIGTLFLLAGSAAATQPPNVLLIMVDDLNCELGCYGSALVKSPQIDRLAARGVRFHRAYCQYPVCNPSRVSLLSGRHPRTARVVDLVTPTRSTLGDTVLLPEYFRRSGYTTIKLGKIFHTGAAFEDPRSWDIDLRETSEAKDPPRAQIARAGWGRVIMLEAPDEATWDGRLARQAAEHLDLARRKLAPFFLAVGFRRPHVPYLAPRRYFEMYPAATIPPLCEPADHVARIPRLALTYACQQEERLDADHRPEVAAAYYASTTFVDAQIGVLLDALDRSDLWSSTIVVFLSDHGYHLGEHGGLWHKMTLFESSARVPLIIAAPGAACGQPAEDPVELVDLYPTLLELCGQPPLAGLEGASLVPLLRDPRSRWDRPARTVVSRVDDRGAGEKLDPDRLGRSVRTRQWRYTEWPDGERELYNYDVDPHEFRNLAGSPDHAAVVEELRRVLDPQ